MPRKIRELIIALQNANFVKSGGQGSHRNFKHKKGIRITVSGKTGDDAKKYQEKAVQKAIEDSER